MNGTSSAMSSLDTTLTPSKESAALSHLLVELPRFFSTVESSSTVFHGSCRLYSLRTILVVTESPKSLSSTRT